LKKHILLYDAIEFGHHKNYVIFFAKNLVSLQCRVSIIFPNAEKLKNEFNEDEINHLQFFDHHKFDLKKSLRFKIWQNWQELKYNFKRVHENVDLMFIMWFDDFKFNTDHPLILKTFLHYFNWTFKSPWFGINVHQVHFRKPTTKHEIWSKELITRHKFCKGVGVFDEGIVHQYQKNVKRPIYVFPDVTKTDLKNESNLEINNKIVLAGVGDRRKGILRFIRASELSENTNWHFSIVGKINWKEFTDTEIQELQNALNTKNVSSTGFIENEAEMNDEIASADFVFAAYEDFPHSSNILTKAAAFKKFVLVNKGFLMAERATKYQLGLVLENDSILDLNLLHSKTSDLNPQFDLYCKTHSMNQLRSVLAEIIE
jgi:glycosyltransferase involved in cell wall biosynthesis